METKELVAVDEWPDLQESQSDRDPRVFVTVDGQLGICVDGRMILMTIEQWHELALKCR